MSEEPINFDDWTASFFGKDAEEIERDAEKIASESSLAPPENPEPGGFGEETPIAPPERTVPKEKTPSFLRKGLGKRYKLQEARETEEARKQGLEKHQRQREERSREQQQVPPTEEEQQPVVESVGRRTKGKSREKGAAGRREDTRINFFPDPSQFAPGSGPSEGGVKSARSKLGANFVPADRRKLNEKLTKLLGIFSDKDDGPGHLEHKTIYETVTGWEAPYRGGFSRAFMRSMFDGIMVNTILTNEGELELFRDGVYDITDVRFIGSRAGTHTVFGEKSSDKGLVSLSKISPLPVPAFVRGYKPPITQAMEMGIPNTPAYEKEMKEAVKKLYNDDLYTTVFRDTGYRIGYQGTNTDERSFIGPLNWNVSEHMLYIYNITVQCFGSSLRVAYPRGYQLNPAVIGAASGERFHVSFYNKPGSKSTGKLSCNARIGVAVYEKGGTVQRNKPLGSVSIRPKRILIQGPRRLPDLFWFESKISDEVSGYIQNYEHAREENVKQKLREFYEEPDNDGIHYKYITASRDFDVTKMPEETRNKIILELYENRSIPFAKSLFNYVTDIIKSNSSRSGTTVDLSVEIKSGNFTEIGRWSDVILEKIYEVLDKRREKKDESGFIQRDIASELSSYGLEFVRNTDTITIYMNAGGEIDLGLLKALVNGGDVLTVSILEDMNEYVSSDLNAMTTLTEEINSYKATSSTLSFSDKTGSILHSLILKPTIKDSLPNITNERTYSFVTLQVFKNGAINIVETRKFEATLTSDNQLTEDTIFDPSKPLTSLHSIPIIRILFPLIIMCKRQKKPYLSPGSSYPDSSPKTGGGDLYTSDYDVPFHDVDKTTFEENPQSEEEEEEPLIRKGKSGKSGLIPRGLRKGSIPKPTENVGDISLYKTQLENVGKDLLIDPTNELLLKAQADLKEVISLSEAFLRSDRPSEDVNPLILGEEEVPIAPENLPTETEVESPPIEETTETGESSEEPIEKETETSSQPTFEEKAKIFEEEIPSTEEGEGDEDWEESQETEEEEEEYSQETEEPKESGEASVPSVFSGNIDSEQLPFETESQELAETREDQGRSVEETLEEQIDTKPLELEEQPSKVKKPRKKAKSSPKKKRSQKVAAKGRSKASSSEEETENTPRSISSRRKKKVTSLRSRRKSKT